MKKTLLFLMSSCLAFLSQASTEKPNVFGLFHQRSIQCNFGQCSSFVASIILTNVKNQKPLSKFISVDKKRSLSPEVSPSISPVTIVHMHKDVNYVPKRQASDANENASYNVLNDKPSKSFEVSSLKRTDFVGNPTDTMFRVHSSQLSNLHDCGVSNEGSPSPKTVTPSKDCEVSNEGSPSPENDAGMRFRSNSRLYDDPTPELFPSPTLVSSAMRLRASSLESNEGGYFLGSVSNDVSPVSPVQRKRLPISNRSIMVATVSFESNDELSMIEKSKLSLALPKHRCNITPDCGNPTPSPKK
jgi:hypothetical protein